MNPLDQIKLRSLMNISSGIPEIAVGLIDGPIDFTHPAFQRSRIRTVNKSQLIACRKAGSIACMHGTFMAGMLSAMRGLNAYAICPNCELILYPIFSENQPDNNEVECVIPSITPNELSKAIVQTIDEGAKIVNLSLGISSSTLTSYRDLKEAYDYALQKGVMLVAVAGNQGNIGHISTLDHHWIIPVASCDSHGRIDPMSNFGRSISKNGFMAPGVNITSTAPYGTYDQMSGTSTASSVRDGGNCTIMVYFSKCFTDGIKIFCDEGCVD